MLAIKPPTFNSIVIIVLPYKQKEEKTNIIKKTFIHRLKPRLNRIFLLLLRATAAASAAANRPLVI